MADGTPSQGNFIGGLAMVLLAVALAFAVVVLVAGMNSPP